MILRTALVACLVSVIACTADNDGAADAADRESATSVVTGSVTYRERMALPEDAAIDVWIEDPGAAAGAAPVAETTLDPAGRQVPIPFELRYDPDDLDQAATYVLKAAIRSGGQTLFTTDAQYRVITQGSPTAVDLMLRRPGPDTGGTAVPSTSALEGTTWTLVDVGGVAALPDVEATLEFAEGGRVAGKASCNQFAGSVAISSQSLSFQPLILTRMACLDPINDQESRYVRALEAAQRFEVRDNELLIYSGALDQPLRFSRAS